jgi:hypothetical protein
LQRLKGSIKNPFASSCNRFAHEGREEELLLIAAKASGENKTIYIFLNLLAAEVAPFVVRGFSCSHQPSMPLLFDIASIF